MSSNRVVLNGMDELRAQLRALPEDLATEAQEIVVANANAAANDIRSGYPHGPTGNLRSHVTVAQTRSRVTTTAKVSSRAPHANIFERGTANRVTNKGWNRGRMPQPPASERMIPKVARQRRIMVEALKALVLRHGATEVSE
jgi:hypothetical protein